MAIVGLRKSFYSKYEPDESGVYKYTGGGTFARMIDVTVTPETNDAELHSDDTLEESDYNKEEKTLHISKSEHRDYIINEDGSMSYSGIDALGIQIYAG